MNEKVAKCLLVSRAVVADERRRVIELDGWELAEIRQAVDGGG
jgi:hypothetical protein